ncbi:immobilization antigen isoform, putative [Ichthyophthirius multifiliis]|uniref:Immobilization antigen isoform, putative n=1 Tax=Ichthyophthirius multifiliis TaxID=5932 RepID=G0R4B4_ICHMU|nr:immobilization antigen isoform, putative [Ichthyophthirius multifiliis]EGR27694.1 immobilization antigen isoform, putative [Ichthyophthirius multifiliis]|eukprot:XP_004025146.1 immobilization antigen isoform, putative [Ichthyophthirius multifiliis]
MKQSFLISLIILLFINKFNFLPCPKGTETNVSGDDDNQGNPVNCVNCKPDYYYNGDNFDPGVSECEVCPIPKQEDAIANPARFAVLSVQCDINCPYGTQTEHGQTVYVQQAEECNFCKDNHFYEFFGLPFEPGMSHCEECSIKKVNGSLSALGSDALQYKQCITTCPTGTVTYDGVTNFDLFSWQCVSCNYNFYFDQNEFLPGISTCKPCPVKKIIGAVYNKAEFAKKEIQCDVECPAGTVVKDGKTTFENKKSECVKCAPNFYTEKQEDWVAGIDICFPCPNILIQGAQANYASFATHAVQCKGAFSQFLTFSLIFIYLYFL